MSSLGAIAARFMKAAGYTEVNFGAAVKVLKRLKTALPWLEDEDFIRIANMAKIEAGGKANIFKVTPENARRLFELANNTKDGKYYDKDEPPEVVRKYQVLMKTGRQTNGR